MTDFRSPLARGVSLYRQRRRRFIIGSFLVAFAMLMVAAPLGIYAALFSGAWWDFYLSIGLCALYGAGCIWAGWHAIDALAEYPG